MTRKIFFFLCISMMLCRFLYAQQNDFRTRTSIEIEKDFKKGFDLSFSYEHRLNQNASNFQGSYITISPSYKINDFLSTNIAFRYATSPLWDKYRMAYYLTAKTKLAKVQYAFRVGYLYEQYKQELPEIDQFPRTHNLRIRLKADRKIIKKVRGFVGVEPVLDLQNDFNLTQIRNTAGMEWEFIKNNFINAEWLWQPRYQSVYLYSTHSLCLNYSIKF